MNFSKTIFSNCIFISLVLTAYKSGSHTIASADSKRIWINFKDMKHIGTVDEHYQSYNVETVEVVGRGFWKPYKYGQLAFIEAASTNDVSQKGNPVNWVK